jgi:hypothetical protein
VSTMTAPNDFSQQLALWHSRTLLHLYAHNRAATRCRTIQTLIGASVAILSASVGAFLVASWDVQLDQTSSMIAGGASIVVAGLAAAQTFAAFPQRISDYERAARRFGAVRREIEVLSLAFASDLPDDPFGELHAIRKTLDAAAEASPNAPRGLWDRTRREISGDFTSLDRLRAFLRGSGPSKQLDSESIYGPRVKLDS